MRVELSDVDELEMIAFIEQIMEVDGLTNHQMDQINDAISQHFNTTTQIARHHDENDWEVWR